MGSKFGGKFQIDQSKNNLPHSTVLLPVPFLYIWKVKDLHKWEKDFF
jgi:hypothetical protein